MQDSLSLNDERRTGPPRVVILGGGYGGVYAALELQKAARRGEIELSLVSRDNYFLFQPMLAEVVSGSIEPPHIVNPIRRLIPHARFHQAEILGVDVPNRSVIIHYPGRASYTQIPYDHLLVAVGSSTDLSGLPGIAEHAFPFRTMGDALFLRNHLLGLLERAEVERDPARQREMMTFVVAGAGYTGVEVAAEINDFVREAARSYHNISPRDVKVVLIQSRERILTELSPELAAFSHRLLERDGIDILLNTRLRGATARGAILTGGKTIPTRTLVAALGSAPSRVLDTLRGERDQRGRLVVDRYLAVPGYEGVWAVGDCASATDAETGEPCPPTAQCALKQARHVARNLLASIRGQERRPFSYKSLGVFVPLGRFSAAAEVMGRKLSGFPAWWLYRTYYLYQLPRLERKMRVVIDWTLELLFHRDIVQIDLARSQALSRAHHEPGEVIFSQGELAENFYIIVAGEVEVFRHQDGQEVSVAVLGPGEYFGEMALLQGGAHTASVRALSPVDLIVMSGSDFTTLASSSTRFGELVASIMRQRQEANPNSHDPQAARRGENS